MDYPYFSNYWRSPRFRTGEVPVDRQQQQQRSQRTQPVQKSPKVVSIPVHFVGSEERRATAAERRSAAALRIQKVFRGFLVRKSVKKIVGIKREVDEIERRISQRETIDAIRKKDSKERLKVNEMLMALLLRLDSVRGVDSGVRECRKSVIKKAIMLQERVDSIAIEHQTLEEISTTDLDQGSEMKEEVLEPLAEVVDQPEETKIAVENHEATDEEVVQGMKEDASVEAAMNTEGEHEPVVEVADQTSELQASVESPKDEDECPEGSNLENNADKGEAIAATLEEEEGLIEREDNLMETVEEEKKSLEEGGLVEQGEEDLMETVEEEKKPFKDNNEGEGIMDSVQQPNGGEQKVEEDSRALMERMIVGNDRLTTLVTELCQRNAIQSQLINSLSQRVEHLEKAFKSERSKRRKKKHA